MDTDPSESAVRAWARLVRVQQALLAVVEHDLKAAGQPPLAWYDVLLELERAEHGRLRPHELERRLLLAQYTLSRLLDRLERAGLVRREPCGEDGRGHWVTLTTAGRERRAQMWPCYARQSKATSVAGSPTARPTRSWHCWIGSDGSPRNRLDGNTYLWLKAGIFSSGLQLT